MRSPSAVTEADIEVTPHAMRRAFTSDARATNVPEPYQYGRFHLRSDRGGGSAGTDPHRKKKETVMTDSDDIRRLEARIAELERLLGGSSGAQSTPASGGTSGDDQFNPVALLAGALARSLPPVGAPQGQGGISAQADTGDSFWMCCSRFICVTPSCGTGTWC
jgi:hypothetical protein